MNNNIKLTLFFILIIFTSLPSEAQRLNLHFGVNTNLFSQKISFSPFGFKLYADASLTEKTAARTNLALNYHALNIENEYQSLYNCFFTQIEESFIYTMKHNIFLGIGIGYYSINNNEEHNRIDLYEKNLLLLGYEEYDSNVGLNILIGKDFGFLNLEIKYIYTLFKYKQKITDGYSFENLTAIYKTMHIISFSISI